MLGARMARAATLLLVLCAAGPAAASRSPSALLAGYGSAGRSLLQDQTSCCALVDATATGGTMTCGPSGLLLTAPSVQFAPIAASISVTGKSGNTAAMTTTALYPQTCSSRFGAATWGSAGGATTLAVAAGSDTTCTTGTDGTCQGLVNELGPVTNSAIAGRHSCSVRATDGAVLCSGNNQFGQLGDGTTSSATATSSTLVAALAPGSGSGILTGATKIAVGGRPESSARSGQSCACLSSGEAVCWGMNTFGQVAAAIPTTTISVPRPAYVVTNAAGSTRLAGCKSVAANLNHTMFLTSTGDIYGAGRNGFSELGLGTTTVTNFAAQVPRSSVNGLAAIAISAGKRHTCAVFEDNTIACVGGNGNGQLGRGFTSSTPSADWGFVSGINDAVDVQCGELSTCVLRKGGKVSCWGFGMAVGNGGVTVSTPFETLSGGAVSIASGDQHVCALMDDITVQCWGKGSNGQLADGLATPPASWLTPQTSTFAGAMSIHAGGGASTCIINGLGQRLCAGNNAWGQLAIPVSNINTSPVPTVIPAALIPSSFSVPSAFVTVSNAASVPVCTLLLSLKVDATCDPTPPVFDPALEDISVDATSAAGAVVTYAPTANDDGAPVTVTCDPASGSQFVIGTTPVTCTAGVTTGTFNVIVAVAAPAFAANAPTTPFEANTNTPYVGANLSGLYTPSASDPVDGDLSASIETFLVSNDEQISLSGVDAYIFPLGSTQIKNTVTNSFGVSSEEFVTIVVVGTTKPVVTVATPLQILVTQPRSAPPKTVNYADKCTATGVATPITITYSPPSGSRTGTTFPVGQTTTVTCTATDAAGNTATGTFTVRVRRPPGQEDGRK